MRRLVLLALVSLFFAVLVPVATLAASTSAAQLNSFQESPQPEPSASPSATVTPEPAANPSATTTPEVTAAPASTPQVTPAPAVSQDPASRSIRTVTATGTSRVKAEIPTGSVYAVQVMGEIVQTDPALTLDAWIAKLHRVRDAVIAAGVPREHVTEARHNTTGNGTPGYVGFNSIFHFNAGTGLRSIAAPQAAWDAGATMVYDNMPAPVIGGTSLDDAGLDAAIAEARTMARDRAGHAVLRGETVGREIATTLVVKGEPERDPTEWQIELTVTFAVTTE